MMEYIKNPRSIKLLGAELKKITDDYWIGKLPEKVMKEYLFYYASNTMLLANNGHDLNITIKYVIGKKRTDLVLKLLDGYQMSLIKQG